MKNFLIGAFKFSVVSVVFFLAITILGAFNPNALLALSIAGLVTSAVAFFKPLQQLLISNRPTAAALMLLSVLGLTLFTPSKQFQQEYQAGLDRKREAQEAADRAELADLKEKVQKQSSLPLDEKLEIYSRLVALDPQNEEYQREKQKLEVLRDARTSASPKPKPPPTPLPQSRETMKNSARRIGRGAAN
jgi:hypothetical protein